ncbi:MAG: hypothetical protein N3F62_09030 [Bacteroidia bacterium]|nr:hypothetical protein [Bacteroidia bacterium]
MLRNNNLIKKALFLITFFISNLVNSQTNMDIDKILEMIEKRCDSIISSMCFEVKNKEHKKYIKKIMDTTKMVMHYSYIEDKPYIDEKFNLGKVKLKYRHIVFDLNQGDSVYIFINEEPYLYLISNREHLYNNGCGPKIHCWFKSNKNIIITILLLNRNIRKEKINFYFPKESKYVSISRIASDREFKWIVEYKRFWYVGWGEKPSGYYIIK